MSANAKRILLWSLLGLILAATLVWAFIPKPIPVDMLTLEPGEMTVTVDEEGETRVRDVFVLSAPIGGRALRIDAEVGDEVLAQQTKVAEIEPTDATLLDPRSEAQARADIRAAEANLVLAEASVKEARVELDFAQSELKRARKLRADAVMSERELEDAERTFRTRQAALETAIANRQARQAELERARAQLISPTETRVKSEDCPCVPIRSPVDGRILKILHKSEGVVAAGEPLVEIGDPTDLEIVADLLSSDAVKVEQGQRVIIDNWGGDKPLAGVVRRVEPFGFTKVSALGIEEQRVNVIIDFSSPKEAWSRIAHGYQVDVRIVLWQGSGVLKLPLTALFRESDQWAAFVEHEGRASKRQVTLGRRTGLEAEILSGISAGERVVVHPGDKIAEGIQIEVRSNAR
ncbi:MAG: efflux transporter periplasmic adaptor subunit [gamma proteobacterium symbiont of Ctena orbiculata]|uniref:HlyD family efflux transporter periplasmic adaptor subunit n=1 Tax=Candidatus Thiodiazotropha taylori TaxID=2792791 RepID=A0A944MDI2_9GAMM|nr:HlyD family efflux transporter periplasmic adaptor subunit [Candidatus Thiodiazotropha taylori]PUB87659.1 MAG: efflux transporter periplasmic adaptor subunit [gamma proteobacterium symbiont of Ctena orbiculata]MBT2989025.1 HlyD family efflux transporter periplasmic adaptor subunit [Candidatus Thiodiazotropha taylori]MBT2996329.1 HlyD family efflux transporter periplasmic adaptor subunit [Candidatus Thiodiazotropha taylori]MBT3000237.1 HlyD family efflux transporter periplasmic adaptor subuni